ncbi:DUF6701 domain-containing protein [Agarivorans gilvus]|uniref:MSHA biogenesis protein MshQ n=1 Tax=Agarivorans gilvus TaxID=680279 RepID=A0ABQ1HXB3_9ALTE|nr:DUF6701 domain-containing protein [Agarivorans gilvus]GGA96178.1 hypothetical protein GCM10007414_06370 [Agarivorans gilvus]
MNRCSLLLRLMLLLFVIGPQAVGAVECSAVFPTVISSSNASSQLAIGWWAQIYGSAEGLLNIRHVNNNSDRYTCPDYDQYCSSSHRLAEAGNLLNIESKANGLNVALNWRQSATLGEGDYNTDNFGSVSASSEATLTFSNSRDEYFIDQLSLGYRATLVLPAGTYWVAGDVNLDTQSELRVVGDGTVKIFVGGRFNAKYQSSLNVSGEPSQLAIYAEGDIQLDNESVSQFVGYSLSNILTLYRSQVTGALHALGDIEIQNESKVIGADVEDVDFAPLCDGEVREPLNLQFGSTGAQQNGGIVSFEQPYTTKPLVFLMTPIDPVHPNNEGPNYVFVNTVLQNASGQWTGFSWSREEPPENILSSENNLAIDWIAVNEGEFTLQDGTPLQAGTVSSNTALPFNNSSYVNLGIPSNLSVVLHQQQSRNNQCWLTTTSVFNGGDSGIGLALENSEVHTWYWYWEWPWMRDQCLGDNNAIPYYELADETIAYLATEPAVGSISVNNQQVNYQFGRSTTHSQGDRTLSPAQTCNYLTHYQNDLFASPPIMVASKNERRGDNGGWLRRCQHHAANFSMITEEDQYGDGERAHVAEDYSFMAFASNTAQPSPGLVISAAPFGLTCDVHEVVIRATLNDDLDQSFQGTVSLSTSTNRGSWSTGDGQGDLQAGVDNGQASYQFVTADQGEVRLGLLHPLTGDVTLTVSDGAITATAVVNFAAYGFQSQLLGTSTGEARANPHKANSEFQLLLTAVGKDPNGGPGCAKIENYQGLKALSLWTDYLEPTTGSRQLQAQNSDDNFVDVAGSYDSRTTLNSQFTAGEALIDMRYPDVGRLNINFWDEAGSQQDGQTITLRGSETGDFIPDRFAWQNILNEDGHSIPSDPENTPFVRAGTLFSAELVAKIANCNQAGTSCNALNFKTQAEQLDIGASLATPSSLVGGELGDFVGGVLDADVAQADGVLAVKDNAWHQVGSIFYQGMVTRYLAYNLADYAVAAANQQVGMFYPHHFELSSASITPTCVAANFSYIGQFEQQVAWTLQAHSLSNQITTNYSHDKFAVNNDFSHWRFSSSSPVAGFDQGLQMDVATGQWLNGVYQQADLAFGLAKPLQPQVPVDDGKLALFFSQYDDAVISSDSVSGGFICGSDPIDGAYCELGTVPELRHGRLSLSNGYGSELQPIAIQGLLQFYDGSRYQTQSMLRLADSCSNLNLPALDFSPKNSATEAPVGGGVSQVSLRAPGIAEQGRVWIDFSAPGEGNRGRVNYWFDLSSQLSWLRDDWNGNGSYDNTDDQAGAGEVTFGVFRQSDKIIYRQRRY